MREDENFACRSADVVAQFGLDFFLVWYRCTAVLSNSSVDSGLPSDAADVASQYSPEQVMSLTVF
jgi:hypothetical protein